MFEGFLEPDELAAAQEALWLHLPRPEDYFADPTAHAWLAADQWAGIVDIPGPSWSLNRLAFHPDQVDLAERFFGSADLRLYNAELWAEYAGAVDHDQRHRDVVNHSLVVPNRPSCLGSARDGSRLVRDRRAGVAPGPSLFGYPAPGDPYWDDQTLADTQTRYPRADLAPYR